MSTPKMLVSVVSPDVEMRSSYRPGLMVTPLAAWKSRLFPEALLIVKKPHEFVDAGGGHGGVSRTRRLSVVAVSSPIVTVAIVVPAGFSSV
jgi:hypothetical protein